MKNVLAKRALVLALGVGSVLYGACSTNSVEPERGPAPNLSGVWVDTIVRITPREVGFGFIGMTIIDTAHLVSTLTLVDGAFELKVPRLYSDFAEFGPNDPRNTFPLTTYTGSYENGFDSLRLIYVFELRDFSDAEEYKFEFHDDSLELSFHQFVQLDTTFNERDTLGVGGDLYQIGGPSRMWPQQLWKFNGVFNRVE